MAWLRTGSLVILLLGQASAIYTLKCPDKSWIKSGLSCFLLIKVCMTWTGARKDCVRRGFDLAQPKLESIDTLLSGEVSIMAPWALAAICLASLAALILPGLVAFLRHKTRTRKPRRRSVRVTPQAEQVGTVL